MPGRRACVATVRELNRADERFHTVPGQVCQARNCDRQSGSQQSLAVASDRAEYRLEPGRVIVELGAGTGPITRVIAAKARPDCRVVVLERDPDFCRLLRDRFAARANFDIIEGDVRDLAAILADRAIGLADYIVSGLPVPSFPGDLQQSLFRAVGQVSPARRHVQPDHRVALGLLAVLSKLFPGCRVRLRAQKLAAGRRLLLPAGQADSLSRDERQPDQTDTLTADQCGTRIQPAAPRPS